MIMGPFYYVRHGQTEWNIENKVCGATDSVLTDFGHQQAIETGASNRRAELWRLGRSFRL